MNVQRLKLWIARIAGSLLRRGLAASERDVAGNPQAPQGARLAGGGLASARWLADTRRLRPRPVPRPRPVVAHLAREQLRQIFTDPRWASAYDAALPPRTPTAPRFVDPHPAQPSSEPLETRPSVPSRPAAASEDAQDQAARERHLAFIRDLVRRGIYNEGFEPAQLPDQYRPRPEDPAE
jgi:hypothetical protein